MFGDNIYTVFPKGDEERVGIMAPGEKAMRFFHPELFDDDYEEDDEEEENEEDKDNEKALIDFIIHELASLKAGEYACDGDEKKSRYIKLSNAINWLVKQRNQKKQ